MPTRIERAKVEAGVIIRKANVALREAKQDLRNAISAYKRAKTPRSKEQAYNKIIGADVSISHAKRDLWAGKYLLKHGKLPTYSQIPPYKTKRLRKKLGI